MEQDRLTLVVLEVADLARSAALYSSGFGLDLHHSDHGGDDRWTSGAHASISWGHGAFLHFALYQSKSGAAASSGCQIGFSAPDVDAAHERALAAGARVIHGPRPEPWGRTARYHDFDGNVISVTAPEDR
jgi:predicted enzyme related to lactoylglutathione lyase